MTATAQENLNSYVAGRFVAANYGFTKYPKVVPRNVTGAQIIVVDNPTVIMPDGRMFLPFTVSSPLMFGSEQLTPSAVAYSANNKRCTIALTFGAQHTVNDALYSASYGLQEALNDAAAFGGVVTVDGQWKANGGTTAMINAAIVPAGTQIENVISGLPSTGFQLSTTLASAAPTITISSIPSSAKDLHITFAGNIASGTVSLELQFNGDSGTHYQFNFNQIIGSTGAGLPTTGATSLNIVNQANAAFNSCFELVIPNYAAAVLDKAATWFGYGSQGAGSSQAVYVGGGVWNSTAAINSVTLLNSSGANFVIGSTLTVTGR